MLSETGSTTRIRIVRVMVASALFFVPLAIGTTPAQSETPPASDTATALVEGAAWPEGGERCGCTGRRGRGHEHGRGHHRHGKGKGKGHGKGHHHGHGCGGGDPDPDPDPAPIPAAAFTSTPSNPAAGRDVQFDASASTGGVDGEVNGTITGWSWDFGDGATGDGATATHSFAEAGEYSVTLTVTNDYGKTNSVSQTVTVIAAPAPEASFTYTPPAPVAGKTVEFDASASTGGVSGEYSGTIVSYSWAFPDGGTAEGAQAAHVFAAGDHAVTLTVVNDFGVSDSVTVTVHVVPPPPPYNPGGGGGVSAPQTASLTVEPGAVTSGTTALGDDRVRVSGSIGFEVPDGVDPAEACSGRVTVKGKSRGVGRVASRAALKSSDGRCVASFRHSLPAAAVGKRVKLVYSFAGNSAVAAWRAQRTLKIRAPR